MKCGVASGWQYPSTRGNLLTVGARWRYSLAQERNAHSDTTACVFTPGTLAVIYDASSAITLSLTLIQQFIYWFACTRAEVSLLQGGDKNNRLPSVGATSIVSQETSRTSWFTGGKPHEAWHIAECLSALPQWYSGLLLGNTIDWNQFKEEPRPKYKFSFSHCLLFCKIIFFFTSWIFSQMCVRISVCLFLSFMTFY